MSRRFDVAVVGGGIVGLAHAWMAVRHGLRTILLERSASAQGASVRNFGMIWPIGQPAGELYSLALRTRDMWLQLHRLGVVAVEECGSLHLAHRADEQALLDEFRALSTHEVRLLSPAESTRQTCLANPEGLLAGMFSPTELRVDPRTACARIAAWLAMTQGVECCFDTLITRIENRVLHAADGRQWVADRVIVCSGSNLRTLYAHLLGDADLELCKLQMLRTVPQADRRSPAHVASGLTLRHYASFRDCPSRRTLERRIAEETPELDRFGIHVMASPFPAGDIILGDSHEYGENITPFDNAEIDQLILRELRKVIRLGDWTIRERWHGIYARHARQPVYQAEVADGVHIFVGTGGAGMTLAFGLAERAWQQWMGDSR